MLASLTLLTIGLPWLGALCILPVGDNHRSSLNFLATAFAVLAGIAALAALPLATGTSILLISFGGVFGDFTLLVAVGLPLFFTLSQLLFEIGRVIARVTSYGARLWIEIHHAVDRTIEKHAIVRDQ